MIDFHGPPPLLTHGQGERAAFGLLPRPRVVKGIVRQGDLGRGLGVFKAAVQRVVDQSGARGAAALSWCQSFESQGFRGGVCQRGWPAGLRCGGPFPAERFRHQGQVLAMRWLCAPYVLAIAPEVDRIHLGSNS
jgi:hypothetical protein